MKIAIGADHAGHTLKAKLAEHLTSQGHEILDVGTSSDEAVDYPRFAYAVARLVADGAAERGIVVDGAGIGSAMAANKVGGIRAALAYDLSSARNSREHNDANVLTLGAGLIGPALAEQIVQAWLEADCQAERHRRRVDQIAAIERDQLELEPTARQWIQGATPDSRERAGDPGQTRLPLGPREAVGRSGASPSGNPAGRASSGVPAGSPVAAEPATADEISAEDLERIARHLEQILASQDSGNPLSMNGLYGPTVAGSPETARRYLDFGVSRLSSGPDPGRIPEDLARCIDHTLLRPDATPGEIRDLCAEAREHGFASVCINPVWVRQAARELAGTDVAVCSVVGFPLGATPPQIKGLEARRAIRDGAREIDMVIQIGALKGGLDDLVIEDIRAVVEACRERGAICKVIIEAALLSDDEKRRACRLARRARAHFVKTSTGFGPGGASVHDVALMAAEVRGAGMEVKAAGGIRSYTDAQRMIAAGATRIGASASLAIVEEAKLATIAPSEKRADSAAQRAR